MRRRVECGGGGVEGFLGRGSFPWLVSGARGRVRPGAAACGAGAGGAASGGCGRGRARQGARARGAVLPAPRREPVTLMNGAFRCPVFCNKYRETRASGRRR